MIGIGLAIGAVVLIARGSIPEGTFLAILVFIALGAIFPPVAVPLGAIILIALFWRGSVGTKVLDWLGRLGSQPSAPAVAAPALGPQAYLQPPSQSA